MPALAYIPSAKILPQTQKNSNLFLIFCPQPQFDTVNRPSVFTPPASKRQTGGSLLLPSGLFSRLFNLLFTRRKPAALLKLGADVIYSASKRQRVWKNEKSARAEMWRLLLMWNTRQLYLRDENVSSWKLLSKITPSSPFHTHTELAQVGIFPTRSAAAFPGKEMTC